MPGLVELVLRLVELAGYTGIVVGLALLVRCAGDHSRPNTRGTAVRRDDEREAA